MARMYRKQQAAIATAVVLVNEDVEDFYEQRRYVREILFSRTRKGKRK